MTAVTETATIRARMLATGRGWVAEHGVVPALPGFSMDELIRRAGADPESVLAVWPGDEAFLGDLLCYLAGPDCLGASAFDEETLNVGIAVVQEHQHLLATADGRMALTREAVRQALPRNLHATMTSPEWRVYVALVGCLPALPAGLRARVAGALASSVTSFCERTTAFYAGMAEVLGLRLRSPGYRLEHLTAAGASLVEGFALRQILARAAGDGTPAGAAAGDPGGSLLSFVDARLPGPGVDGGTADWPLLATAFLGLVETFFEPDPGFVPKEAV
jgi:hypothetical protein